MQLTSMFFNGDILWDYWIYVMDKYLHLYEI